jgi:hypothetical protein
MPVVHVFPDSDTNLDELREPVIRLEERPLLVANAGKLRRDAKSAIDRLAQLVDSRGRP